ncbi:lytic transglycosylase domain-containing protein [Paraburkholderia sediminicola]|uniref:lytic transglycosylase domain-containing protein n=1 Tax=Paraburkholderia sediminicola TaxID=458836 RepID=UPI0038BDF18D
MIPAATCIAEASDAYHVQTAAIDAVIAHGLPAGEVRDGRVGPMAIPVQWLPVFELMGIKTEDVVNGECQNILAGTWIMAYMQAIQPMQADGASYAAGRYSVRFPAWLQARRQAWAPVVQRAAQLTGIPAALIDAVITVESKYNPAARSGKNAIGMMQLLETTAALIGGGNPRNPEDNIMMGSKYLAQLATKFNGDLPLTLAAYNAGPGAVTKRGYRIPPFPETQAYVPQVIALYSYLQQHP